MCNECYSKGCRCDCIFEDAPTADILSGPFRKECSSCGHSRDLYGDYDADEYDRTKGDRF